jgi:hypothetical protein
MKIPILDRKEIPLCNHRKYEQWRRNLAGTRETGSLPRNFSVIGKNSAEAGRYHRIYSDNDSECPV